MKYQVSLYTGNTAEEWAWIQCITKQWNGYYYDPMSWTDTPGGDLGILHKLHLPAVPHHELQALYEAGTIFSYSVHRLKEKS